METFEITVDMPDGDWRWRHRATADFHEACQYGLEWAEAVKGRLVRVDIVRPRGAKDD